MWVVIWSFLKRRPFPRWLILTYYDENGIFLEIDTFIFNIEIKLPINWIFSKLRSLFILQKSLFNWYNFFRGWCTARIKCTYVMAINATQITFLCSTIRSLGIANEHDGENLKIYVFSCSAGNIYIFLLSGLKAYLSKWGVLTCFCSKQNLPCTRL